MKQFYDIFGKKHTVIGEVTHTDGTEFIVYACYRKIGRRWIPGAKFKEEVTELLGRYYFKTRKAYLKWERN